MWGYLQGGPGNLEPYLFFYPGPPALCRGEEEASLRRQLGGVLRRHRLCYRRLSHRAVYIVCASRLETLVALGLALLWLLLRSSVNWRSFLATAES